MAWVKLEGYDINTNEIKYVQDGGWASSGGHAPSVSVICGDHTSARLGGMLRDDVMAAIKAAEKAERAEIRAEAVEQTPSKEAWVERT